MAQYRLISNAKINFGLKVVQKRPDGFHNIETIFFPINLSDTINLSVEPSNTDHNSVIISTNKDFIPLNEKNLCYKAIEKFFIGFGISEKFNFNLGLTKYIPVGGGLGGGSSNAASILKALVRHFEIDVAENKDKIIEIALNVGSDVPFFLVGKPCFAQGRGEKLSKLESFDLKGYSVIVVNPGLHISTKWAFESLGMTEGVTLESHIQSVKTFSTENYLYLQNDFEHCVFEKFPVIGKIKKLFADSGAVYSSMSGTGASVFGVYNKSDNKRYREKIIADLRKAKYFVYSQSF